MTTITSKPKTASILSTHSILLTGMLVALIALAAMFLLGHHAKDVEANGYAYTDLIVAQKVCPPIVPQAKAALADGTLTVKEAHDIASSLYRLSSAYDEAVTMADAKRQLGLRPPVIPAACRDTADDDSGPMRLLEGN